MASISKIKILDYSNNFTQTDKTFSPGSNVSWECHSVTVDGGSADIYLEHDPDDDDTWEQSVLIYSLDSEKSIRAEKLELDPQTRIRVDETTGDTISVSLLGVEIT